MDPKTAVTIIILCIPFFIGTVWGIVDAAQKDFGSIGKKALWTLVAAIPFIGFLIYLAFGFRKGRKTA
ncbi:MAG: PLDc N-terminal domain-containing protein [Desulfobacterales bacterium]